VIKQVTLKNFQAHKDSVLEFDKGVNILTGASDSGKSAVLRALRWVVFNKPNGDDMVSHWCYNEKGKQIADTTVILEFTDGTIVERTKGKEGNIYKLNGQVIEAFGMDVPQVVVDACNFSEVNLQSQLDSHFLLSESSGEVARFLNRIVKLDKIDSYQAGIEKKKRATKNELDTILLNLSKVDKELATFGWTEEAGKLLARLEKLNKKALERGDELSGIKSSMLAYADAEQQLKRYEFVSRAEAILGQLSVLIKEKERLNTLADDIDGRLKEHDKLQVVIGATQYTDKAEKLVQELVQLRQKHAALTPQIEDMEDSLADHKQAEATMKEFPTLLAELEAELPSVCPTCGKELQ
jgi:exonuclease SbcC